MESAVWRLYLHIKRISELICAETLSENQLIDLDHEISMYLDLRIALKIETEQLSEKEKKVDAAQFEHLGDLTSKVQWPVVKPKHTFLLSYVQIIIQICIESFSYINCHCTLKFCLYHVLLVLCSPVLITIMQRIE